MSQACSGPEDESAQRPGLRVKLGREREGLRTLFREGGLLTISVGLLSSSLGEGGPVTSQLLGRGAAPVGASAVLYRTLGSSVLPLPPPPSLTALSPLSILFFPFSFLFLFSIILFYCIKA